MSLASEQLDLARERAAARGLDGFVLEAADPGATMTFTTSGIVLNGFALMPL